VIGIGVRYLNGWAMASHPADRSRAEWPPHPDRVFMALAAAHFETGGDPAEAAVLERLEVERPVVVAARRHQERDPVTVYVPVNDTASPVKGSGKNQRPSAPLGSLPMGRDRQPRQFPVALPEEPTVHLRWPGLDLSPAEQGVLARLCGKVTYVGHSASLVQAWLEDAEPQPPAQGFRTELLPVGADPARYRLRVPSPGRLTRLREDFAAGLRPRPAAWSGYEPRAEPLTETEEPVTCFDPDLLVLRKIDGPDLGLESTLQVTRALRDTVLSLGVQPPPEWVSGHRPDRAPSQDDHLAFLPLPHVGREHADGHLLGLALAVPRHVPSEERRRCLQPLLFDELGALRTVELRMGRLGLWKLQLEEREMRPLALRPETWSAAPPAEAAIRWATVTPISLDRHPKGDDLWVEMEASVRRACLRIGLPEPEHVVLSPVSLFPGAPAGRSFPLLRRGGEGGRVRHTHAVLIFAQAIRGPLLLGAGRYRGYGLCRPVRGPEKAS
jgi:CRISPR-associated protein Csb2